MKRRPGAIRLQHADAMATRVNGARDMVMLAFDNPRETARRPALTEREKAMLFDLAMAAGGSRGEGRDDTLAAAPLIRAFAQAYVTIRDREDGIV